MARKHVHAPPRRNVVPMESHSDGQNAGYFSRTLRTVLLELGSSEPSLFNGTVRLLHENFIPLACTCGGLREAYDRSYLPHSPSDRGTCTEVDV
jgi:hypothetical protein